MISPSALVVPIAIIGAVVSVDWAQAQEGAPPTVIRTNELELAPSPVRVLAATAAGNPTEPGSNYVLYVKYPAGTKSLPHTHRDQRITTVISGTFYAGEGPVFDEKKVSVLKPGEMVVIPAGTVHWGWAKDGDVILSEVGIGPTSTVPLQK